MHRNSPPNLSKSARTYLQPVRQNHDDSLLSFDILFDRFSAYVASVAFRLTGDESGIDDIVQDVFMDCCRNMHKIHNTEHARRWLAKVTVRKSVRLLRRRKVLRFLHLSPSISQNLTVPDVSADDRAMLAHLYLVLEQLPVKTRTAWCLRYLEGAELTEVAATCDCSLATAKRRILSAQRAILGADND